MRQVVKPLYGIGDEEPSGPWRKGEGIRSGTVCPVCNTTIDDLGWCACDTIGGG